MGRLLSYLQSQAALTPGRAPYPIRLTPGQYADFRSEAGDVKTITTCLGVHPVELIECHTKATGHNVILAPRGDIFAEVERDTGVELVCLANDITSVPDNVACCEIISVGELVQGLKPGDLAFIDFFEVKQGYVLDNEELYIAGSEAFKGLFDVERQAIIPMNNYVVTRRASDRMLVSINGTDRIHVPAYVLTDGIASGRTSQGSVSTHIIYEEVVSIGPLTVRGLPNLMTRLESQILSELADPRLSDGDVGHFWPLIEKLRAERRDGRLPDFQKGDLVAFCKEIGTRIRVRGEFQHLIPYHDVLAVIDDASILDGAIRAGKAGVLQVA